MATSFRAVSIPETILSPEEWSNYMDGIMKRVKFLGGGAYGQAYIMPNGHVLKIARDNAYRSWVSHALAMQGNSAVPRIYNAHVVVVKYPPSPFHTVVRITIVEMECLQPLPERVEGTDAWTYASRIERYAQSKLSDFIPTNPRKPRTRDAMQVIACLIYMVRNNYKLNLDIHSSNVMLRGKTLVFTDPLSGG